jgi:hypothetical protein
MFTGWRPSPAVQYPSIGSIVSHELGSRNDLPPYVCVPSQPNSFAGTGFLLNDEMDDFTSKPGVPNTYGLIQGEANAIQPQKRPLSSMTPTIVM